MIIFDTHLSELEDTIFWTITYQDIKKKMQLYIASKQMEYVQDYQIFMKVVSVALGGSGSNSTEVEAATPKTAAQARRMIATLEL